MNWKKFESAEDLAHELGVGVNILFHDGCDFVIDYVETEVEHGTYFMANDTRPEQYCELDDENLIAIHDNQVDDVADFGGG